MVHSALCYGNVEHLHAGGAELLQHGLHESAAEVCRWMPWRSELRAELQVLGIPTLLWRQRLRYVARAARAGTPQLSALLQKAGGKTTLEEQARLDRQMANFRRDARQAGLSFLACTKADGTA